ncbi:MAG: choice-of-anchor D domain-containing protein [FCB group bacterium]|jgi:uncharacterized protein YegL
MKKLIIYLVLIFLGCISFNKQAQSQPTKAQFATIDSIYYDAYPCLRATYAVWDSAGNDMRVNNANDIIITENGKIKTQCANSPACSQGERSFSAILLLDMSSSMEAGINPPSNSTPKYMAGQQTIRDFISRLPHTGNIALNCEVAIVEFGGGALLITGFTDNIDTLWKKTGSNYYQFLTYTDYNAGFIVDRNGDSINTALDVAKKARYKPVIIFMTDGKHMEDYAGGNNPADGPFKIMAVRNICKSRRPSVYVFAIKIGTDTLDPVSESYLKGLAGIEVGTINGQPAQNYYPNITDPDQLSSIYQYIADVCGQVGYPSPCDVKWKTDCAGGGNLMLNFPAYNNLSASYTFAIPDGVKPNLDVTPRSITFNKDNPTGNYDTTIVIKALQNAVDVNDPPFSSPDPRYKITDWGVKGKPPFTLAKGESTTITLEYSPMDSLCSHDTLNVLGSMCTGSDIEVQGRMSLFAPKVDMGSQTINTTKNQLISNEFCNRWCTPVLLKKIIFSGGDAPSFKLISTVPPLPATLQPGQCIDLSINFIPLSTGTKNSTIEFQTDAGNVDTVITGIGTGTAGIDSDNPITFNLACPAQSPKDITFQLKNTGPIPMTVDSSNLIGKDAGEFSVVNPNPVPFDIAANSNIDITIRFAPHSAGIKTCSLEVKSSATNLPTYDIILQGTLDSINYEPSSYTYDLGTVCLGTPKDITIPIQNTGTKDLQISAFNKPATVTLNPGTLPVIVGQTANFDLTYTPDIEGPINSTLVLTEANCSWQKTIALTGTVYDPKVTTVPPNVIVSSNTNVATQTTITITNPSAKNDLIINSITPQDDPPFKFISSTPKLPTTLKAGETMQIVIQYLPPDNTVVNSNLVLTGMPCHDVLIPLTGNPAQATADIVIDTYSGLVGQVTPVNIRIDKPVKFAESNTNFVNTTLTCDAMLDLASNPDGYSDIVNGTTRTITLINLTVQKINAPQIIKTLNMVLSDCPNPKTTLVLSNTSSDQKNVAFNPVDGEFDCLAASEIIQTKNYSARPGEEVDILIYQSNGVNMSSFHKSISTDLKFNATLLEPIGGTNMGTVDRLSRQRTVPLDGIPVNTTATEQATKTFKFRAMLGDSVSTQLILQNSRVEVGQANFDETNIGTFTLLGVCKNITTGVLRLYDPTGTAQFISIKPNPASSAVQLDYEISEKGNTKIWLANVLGNNVLTLLDEYSEAGVKSLSFNTMDLSNGVYFIIMQTPTQIFNSRISIIK